MKKLPDETVLERLRKIAALAKQGYEGEAKAASLLLEKQLEKYGLTLEDMLDEVKKRRDVRYTNMLEFRLLANTLANHFGTDSAEVESARWLKRKKKLSIEMTDADYADFSAEWEYYRGLFKRERKRQEEALVVAFVNKFNLFDKSKDNEDKPAKELSKEDLEVLRKAAFLQMSIENNPYHKMLEK